MAGADRACAEWVLRNGGSIKWKDSATYLTDYNLLPRTDFHNYHVEGIDLTGTDVIDMGFRHLGMYSNQRFSVNNFNLN